MSIFFHYNSLNLLKNIKKYNLVTIKIIFKFFHFKFNTIKFRKQLYNIALNELFTLSK